MCVCVEREEEGGRERVRAEKQSSTQYRSHMTSTTCMFRLALNTHFDGFLRAPSPTVPGTIVSPDTESRCSAEELEVAVTMVVAAARFLSLLISLQVSSSDSSDELSSSLGLPSSSCVKM